MTRGERWSAGGDLREVALRTLLVGAWLGAAVLAVESAIYYIGGHAVGMDAHAYWLSGRVTHPYGPGPEQEDAYLYSPLFAQAMRLVAWMPWPAFCGLLMTLSAALYYWLVSPLTWRWRVPVLLLCIPELLIGNIYAPLAASLVLGVRHPSAWSFPALTKITPGGVGLVWFAVRGQWRQVAWAVAVTLALTAGSVALQPHLWLEWGRFLVANSGHGGIVYPLRVLGAVLVAAYAARRGPTWLLAVAFYLAMPLAGFGQTLTILVATVRLGSGRPAAGPEAATTPSAQVPADTRGEARP